MGFLYDKVNGSVARAVINDKSSPVHGMASANAALPAPRLLSEATEAQPDFRSRSPPSIPVSSGALIEDSDHSLRAKSIPMMTLRIVARLRSAGHDCYVVGGAVRDLLLGQTPKDFDILTTATPIQVKKLFRRAFIVGKRYPIVHVCDGPVIHEVSSFQTNTDAKLIPQDISGLMDDKAGGRRPSTVLYSEARRENAQQRDFTVNGLLFDPFSGVLYDYVGGVLDCKQRTLRTIEKADASFRDDPARILRAVRHASRAGLSMDADTSKAAEQLAHLLMALPSGRLVMEVHAIFAYGAAESAMRTLWRMRLADLILPQHGEYLTRKKCARKPRLPRQEALFDVLAELDKLASPAAPVDTAVWVATLALPLIVESFTQHRSKHPHEPSSGPADLVFSSQMDDEALHSDEALLVDDESAGADAGDESALGDDESASMDESALPGTETVKLNRKMRRALKTQLGKGKKRKSTEAEPAEAEEQLAEAQEQPAAAAETIEMPSNLLRVFRQVVAAMTQPVAVVDAGSVAVVPRALYGQTVRLLVEAHTFNRLAPPTPPPPQVVIRGEEGHSSFKKGSKGKRLTDGAIVAQMLQVPSLQWQQLTQ